MKQRLEERREGADKAYDKAIEILKGRFDRATDPAERAAIEQQLREAEDDYLPYLTRNSASIRISATTQSRRVRDVLAPTGAIEPDMPDLSAPSREALEQAAATIAALDPPKTADDHFLQGNAFYAAGDYDRALEEYNRALEIKPDDPDSLRNRGVTLRLLKRYEEAISDCNRALELSPDDPVALNDRGAALIGLQRYRDALADIDRSLELSPAYRCAFYNRACLFSLVHRLPESLEQLKQALPGAPAHRKEARDDEEFANLRADPKLGPEFERLVAGPEE